MTPHSTTVRGKFSLVFLPCLHFQMFTLLTRDTDSKFLFSSRYGGYDDYDDGAANFYGSNPGFTGKWRSENLQLYSFCISFVLHPLYLPHLPSILFHPLLAFLGVRSCPFFDVISNFLF